MKIKIVLLLLTGYACYCLLPSPNGVAIEPLPCKRPHERTLILEALAGDGRAQYELIRSWQLPFPPEHDGSSRTAKKIGGHTLAFREMLSALLPEPSLTPQLVLVSPYSSPNAVAHFKRQGIAVHRLKVPKTYEELCHQLEEVGHLCDRLDKGKRLALILRGGREKLQERLAAHPPRQPFLVGSLYGRLEGMGRKSLFISTLEELLPDPSLCLNSHLEGVFQPVGWDLLAQYPPALYLLSSPSLKSDPWIAWGLRQDRRFNQQGASCVLLDEATLHSLSQWIFLALYDLCESLQAYC